MTVVEPSSSVLTIRRPTAPPLPETSAPSFTYGQGLEGARIGIRADSAWRSWQYIGARWAKQFEAAGATTEIVLTGAQVGDPRAGDRVTIDRLAAEVDVALVGLGTCGSCTSYTIADAVALEAAGRPVIAIVCEEFATHGRNMARHLGHGDLKVLVVPYPLEARPADELDQIADEYYPKALDLLGITR